MFDKSFIFELAGRQVIYGPEEEYNKLPETHKWRHVRYEPTATPRIDWTWEREWRLKQDVLHISPENAVIVVPEQHYADRLVGQHETERTGIRKRRLKSEGGLVDGHPTQINAIDNHARIDRVRVAIVIGLADE